MATQGKNAAYRQLTAPQDTLSADIQYWNNDAFRKKQEARIAENAKLAREAEANKERQARLEKYAGNIKNYNTGNKSITEMQGRGLMDAVDMIPELLDITDPANSSKYSKEEIVRAQVKLTNLGKAADNMKAVTDAWMKRDATIMDAIQTGKVRNNDKVKGYLDLREKGFDKAQITFDDMGMPLVAYRDLNSDKIADVETYDSLLSGQSAFKFDKNFDPLAQAKALVEEAKDFKIKDITDNNYLKTTTEGYDPESMEYAARTQIVDTDGDITDFGQWILDEHGLEDSVENREKAYQYFKGIVDKVTPRTSVQQDMDYNARNSAGRLARDLRNDQKKDEETAPAEIELDTTSDGSPSKTTPPGGGTGDIFSFSPSTPIKAGTKEQPIEINKLFMSKDGKLSFTGSKKVGDETVKEDGVSIKRPVYKDVAVTPLNEQQLNSLSRLINDPATGTPFKNQKELVDHLKSKIGGGNQEPKKLSIKASDIAAKAKAAGYTEKEYRKLLEEKGVTIE